MRTPIIIITTTTIKIPKPIPALKIPAIALHELTINEMRNMVNAVSSFEFFIANNFFILYLVWLRTDNF